MRGLSRKFGLSAIVLGAFFGPAAAADMPTKAAPIVTSAPVPWLQLFAGLVVVKDSTYGYAGGVAALNRNLNQDGWLVRLAGGDGHYKYNIVPGLSNGVDFQTGEFMIGYQKYFGDTRVTGYVGANVEDHHNGSDPLAVINGTKFGIKGQGEIFAPINPYWYFYGQGSISSVWNNYFLMAKAGYNISPVVSVGPEVISLGNERFDAVRVGPFIGFNATPSAQIILSGGYSWDTRRDNVNDHSGAYGTIHIRATF
jgi:Cellulose biosynthesis protein BcsS